jgi:hypothetical protein
LLTDFPEIKEMDLNPIKVLEDNKGIVIMDAKAIIDEQIISTAKPKIKLKEDTLT